MRVGAGRPDGQGACFRARSRLASGLAPKLIGLCPSDTGTPGPQGLTRLSVPMIVGPLHEVREFAGHSDIRTTEVYFVRKEEDAEVAARRIQIRRTGPKGQWTDASPLRESSLPRPAYLLDATLKRPRVRTG